MIFHLSETSSNVEPQKYKMFALNLPPYPHKISVRNGHRYLFDEFRKRPVALTPEEWVRQHFCHYLVNEKACPASLIANEYRIRLHGLDKRCDTVVFDRSMQVWMIVEYKAPFVNIDQKVFDQILRYNWVLKAPYLVVSNGRQHFCCHFDYQNSQTNFLSAIPMYPRLS